MTRPLSDVRVLEVAQWWFVPASGAVLADWGAEVVKIEHPVVGDPQRGLAPAGYESRESGVDFMVQQSNRGKRSMGIDLATEAGHAILLQLVRRSDVFLTSFLPEARKRLRIDVDDVREANPNIIYVRGSGQGPAGPDAEKGGYDTTSFWARGGIASVLTPPELEAPIMPRATMGDSVGALALAGGIAAALFRRERAGEAAVMDVSLLNTALWMLAPDVVASCLRGPESRAPASERADARNPLANPYRTRDGRWLMLMMIEPDRYWLDFCRHIDQPKLAADPRYRDAAHRFDNRRACVNALDRVFEGRTLAEWTERFATLMGPWAPIQSVGEVQVDPQVLANGYLPEVELGGRRVRLVASPVHFDEAPHELSPAPEMGQHTEEVLLELGYGWEAIRGHKDSGTIN